MVVTTIAATNERGGAGGGGWVCWKSWRLREASGVPFKIGNSYPVEIPINPSYQHTISHPLTHPINPSSPQ